ncbi:MAG: glycoside hydrolase family 3 N-terminal domain-containing protein [Bacteroidia bacterium]
MKKIFSVLFILSSNPLFSQVEKINWEKSNAWVDSVYNSMSDDDHITQLMMLGAWASKDSTHYKYIEKNIRENKIGGLIFFKGTPTKQALLTNYFQSISTIPLIIGIDGEWGLSMRLDSTPVFPKQMVLGGCRNEEVTYEMGRSIGRQCRRIGIHFNFAPDVDVNNNPNNPVINDRSFGENKYLVAKLGAAYAKGLQDERVIACAKHFPGHGDVESDSHYTLPVVKANRARLDSLELFPFKELIKKGVMSVMIAHLNVPVLDSLKNYPSSLSRPVVSGLLKNELGFNGLVITDALNMKGVTDFYGPGEVVARALAAGNDILLCVEDVPLALAKIKEYISKGFISPQQVEASCKKMLKAKYWLGLNHYKPIEIYHLNEDLNCCANQVMVKKILKQGIILAKNEEKMIPLQNPELYHIAVVCLGTSQFSAFQEMCTNYIKADYFCIDKNESDGMYDSLAKVLDTYNLLILSIENTSRFLQKKYGLSAPEVDFINRITAIKKNIFVCNGNPYLLRSFTNLKNVIVSYEDADINNLVAAEVLFGTVQAAGTMPVTVNETYPLGCSETTELIDRFEYIIPEEKNIDSEPLGRIDTIVNDAITKGAMPGCQVLVAKNGKVIYNKSFGSHNYDGANPVKNYHLYDLASLTKMLATTLAIMHLYDEKKISPDDHLGEFLPWLRGTNKEFITIRNVMLHQAGLVPFIPFYKTTLVNGKPNPIIYAEERDSDFCIPVAQNLFMNKNYEPVIWKTIAESEIRTPGDYVYSDLGFMMLRKVVEQISKTDFETYLNQNIYIPLNLGSLQFNPNGKMNPDWIVPTELDTFFRWQQLDGTVHDPAAAMLGGVSGHAGLFSNANDVAVIMQMLLNGGTYGGKRILQESTVKEFTSRQNPVIKKLTKKQEKEQKKNPYSNRRGLGFDKPETDPKKQTPTSRAMSPLSFGHTGFTGTCAWADPKNNLIYVFLSNRVNPTAENKKLVDMNVRTRILDAVYEALKSVK